MKRPRIEEYEEISEALGLGCTREEIVAYNGKVGLNPCSSVGDYWGLSGRHTSRSTCTVTRPG